MTLPQTMILRAVGRWTMPLLACLLGLTIAAYPMILSGFQLMPGDPGDLRLNHYIVEHEYRAWSGTNAFGFWHPGFFHPTPNLLAYSDLLLGAMPFYAVFRASGVSPESAFQAWILLMFALDFVTFFVLLRELGFEALPASFGSYLFAFGSPRVAQINHPQLLPHFYSVAAVIFAVRVARSLGSAEPARVAGRDGPRVVRDVLQCRLWMGASAACVVLQLYTSYYLGWFLVLGTAVFALWSLGSPRVRLNLRELLRQHWGGLTVVLILALLALAPMVWHYGLVVREVGPRGYDQVLAISPPPQAWLYMGRGSWLYDWMNRFGFWRDMSLAYEKALGVGLFTTIVAFCGLYGARRRCSYRVLLATSASLGLASTLFFGRFSPWQIIYDYVPGAMAVRAVARIGLLLLIPAAIGLALFLESIQRRFVRAKRSGALGPRERSAPGGVQGSPPSKSWMALAVGLVCVVEQGRAISAFDKERAASAVNMLATAIDPARCGYFYFSPLVRPGETPAWVDPRDVASWGRVYAWKYQLDAMWAGLERGVPTINGYSGNSPQGYAAGLSSNVISGPDEERRLSRELERWIARHGLDRSRFCWIKSGVDY